MNWFNTLLSSTVFQTIVSGVLVFILGQFFLERVVKPRQEYAELKGRVVFGLNYYANTFFLSSESEKKKEAAEYFRRLACDLSAYQHTKPAFLFITRKNLALFRVRLLAYQISVRYLIVQLYLLKMKRLLT